MTFECMDKVIRGTITTEELEESLIRIQVQNLKVVHEEPMKYQDGAYGMVVFMKEEGITI